MKLLILTAIIAAVASSPVTQNKSWPWQISKEYVYDVDTYTLTKYDHSNTNGNAFKAQFIIRVLAPGHLMAKLSKPLYAQIHDKEIIYGSLPVPPSDLKYQPVLIPEQPFDIFVEGGRVKSLGVPITLSVEHKNLLKGLVSALQVDLSPYAESDTFPNSYDKESFQGLFKKMESDVTGNCETLYVVSPVSAEWRRELPEFSSEEDPVEIIKSKNYGSCKKRVALYFGVPEGALWNGIAYENEEKQFIKHTFEQRLVAGKQGTIFKSEVLSAVFVSPLLFGKQKAEVQSYVKVYLSTVQETSGAEWKKADPSRRETLLFSLSESMFIPNGNNQSILNAQKLLQDLTPLLQSPNKLPKADFLSKFNILVRLISTLSTEQLTLLTDSVEIAKTSKNAAKAGMWTIYRDAVAQAGSFASFEQIKSWVLAKKIHGIEAAELITSVGSNLRYPTNKKFVKEFFEFATNSDVMQQQYVNNSAWLAATKYIRFNEDKSFVVNTVIPRLSNELKHSVESGDSSKAQVYVRVLGNLAHPDILKVFAPYLDGRIAVSKYLRVQIVASLRTLANKKNEQVRAVLYSILKNTAEVYEVRVAAALNIFMTVPTSEMMQVMARMTNEDLSIQVRSVLTHGINFSSGLKDPRFTELAKSAQSVKTLVSKEKFGYDYSTNSLVDDYTSDEDFAYFKELSYIGSEDNFFPKYHRAALRTRSTGWTEENQITLSVTGMQQLLNYIIECVIQPDKSKVDFKFSAQKIVEMLKIKREPHEPIEGSLFLESFNQQNLFTFNEADLQAFVLSTVKNVEQLLEGFNVQYTKILSSKQVYVVFPLAAGVPFFFEYSEPVMYSLQGQFKIKLDTDTKALRGSLQNDLDITYARNLDGSVGFLDTLGNVYVAAGVINKLQFYFPSKLNTVFQAENIKLNVVLPENDANFIHMSVWPYTTIQKTDSLLPVSETPLTKYIERPTKTVSTDLKLGYLAGISVHLQGYSFSSDFKNTDLYDDDLLTSIGTLLYQKDVALTKFDLKYFAKDTINKNMAINLFYETLYNQKEKGEMGPATVFTDVTANSEGRRKEMAKRVASGIDEAEVRLVDISTVFDGQRKVEYVFTAALANSLIDNKAQAAIFNYWGEQFNAVFKMIKPKIIPLNFEDALKNEMKVLYEADFKFGNTDNIHFKGYGKRSNEYTQMLKNDPMAKQCLQQISNQNLYQMDCYKMIVKAHAPDYFKGTVTFKELSPEFLSSAYSYYEMLKEIITWDQEEDVLKKIDAGNFDIEAQAFYYDNYINFAFTTKYGTLHANNVEGMDHFPYGMAIYTPTSNWERAENVYSGYQYLPYCAVDSSKVWTFSGRSYNYSLTSSWHVVMVDEMNELGKWTEVVMLARRPSEKHEEVYVSYKTATGKYFELDIKPTAVEVKSDAKKVSEGALTTYWNDDVKAPLLQYYTISEGILVFNINNGAIRLVYDSQRLVIFTSDHRNTTRGICGQSSTQPRDDYMTPYGLVDLPEYYGASFSLDDEFSDPKTVELKKEAKLKAYQPIIKYTNILRSDTEWSGSKIKNASLKGLRNL